MNHLLFFPALFLVALLYSSVGHGGASGYIAVMTLAGLAPDEIKPTALMLNIVVSAMAFIQFYSAGHFRRDLLLPFVLGSIPFSLMGGYIHLSTPAFNMLMGLCLFYAGVRLLLPDPVAEKKALPPFGMAVAAGSAIGLLSGMIGVGGGIFLTPLLLLMGWASVQQAAAVSAPFIFLNSVAGLAGLMIRTGGLDIKIEHGWFLLAVVAGGAAGSLLGSKVFSPQRVRQALSIVLLVASAKLIFV